MARTPWPEASFHQQRALAWVPKITSLLSILGSCYIVFDILRLKQRNTYHRILLGMNIVDLMCGSAWFFTTWPIPQEHSYAGFYYDRGYLPEDYGDYLQDDEAFRTIVQGARGNQATCNAQGYFSQLSISVVLYNASLALYFLVVIRFGWTEAKINQAKLEWYIHMVCIGVGLLTSSLALGLDLYNPVGWQCWIGAWPIGCDNNDWDMDDNAQANSTHLLECERGANADLYLWFLFYLPLWACIIFASGALYQVYAAFHRQKKQGDRWKLRYAISRGWGLPGHFPKNNPHTTPQNTTQEHQKRNSMDGSTQDQNFRDNRMDDCCSPPGRHCRDNPTNDSSNARAAHRSGQNLLGHFNAIVSGLKSSWKKSAAKRANKKRKKPNAKAQLVTSQALLYVFSFYVAWFFPSVLRIQESISADGIPMYHWVFLSAFFVPLQGVLNFVIYLRPKYIQIRLIKQRIAALAEKQQRQQQQQQMLFQLHQQGGNNSGKEQRVHMTDNSHSNHSNNRDHSNSSSNKSPVYGRVTTRPLIDSSKSLDPLMMSEFDDEDDMSMELSTMMRMVEQEMEGAVNHDGEDDMSWEDGKGYMEGTQHKKKQNDGDDWNKESIDQLHSSFTGNLSLTQLKNTISGGATSVGHARSYGHMSNNSSANTDTVALFNESLNIEQLDDLVEEEGEEEDDEDEERNEEEDYDNFNDDLSEDIENGSGANDSSSDEEMDPALENLFESMTLNSGNASLWQKEHPQRQRRPTLKRSNSSEYNFASMRSITEEVTVNPRIFERFNASMNIDSEGHVIGRSQQSNKYQVLQRRRPHDKRLRNHQSSHMPNRAMAADNNPMSLAVPLTIGSSEHRKKHVPVTKHIHFEAQTMSVDDQKRRDTVKTEAVSIKPLGEDNNATDEDEDGDGDGSNRARGSLTLEELGMSERACGEKQSEGTGIPDTIIGVASSPISEEDVRESSHKVTTKEGGLTIPQKNPLAELRIARTNRRLIPLSGTDPEQLARMRMHMSRKNSRIKASLRRRNTAPTLQPTRDLRGPDDASIDGAAAEHSSRRTIRRMSDRLNPFRKHSSDHVKRRIEPTASSFTRTGTSDEVLHSLQDAGSRRLRRSSKSAGLDKRKQMLLGQAKQNSASKWATARLGSFRSFAENVRDALKSDDLREWADVMHELEMELSAEPGQPVVSLSCGAPTEESKQELMAIPIERPPENQTRTANRPLDGTPRRGTRRFEGNRKLSKGRQQDNARTGTFVPQKRVPRAARTRKDSD